MWLPEDVFSRFPSADESTLNGRLLGRVCGCGCGSVTVGVIAGAAMPHSSSCLFVLQSFADLAHRPLLVDLTVEEGQRLKVIYGSCAGFHAVDVDSGSVYDIYLPTHVRKSPSDGLVAWFCPDFLYSA